MRFFFYGTLVDAELRRAVLGRMARRLKPIPATLDGFEARLAAGRRYPLAVRRRGGVLAGVLVALPHRRAAARIAAYEGPEYRLVRCVARIAPESKLRIAPESKLRIAPESKLRIAPENKVSTTPKSKLRMAAGSKARERDGTGVSAAVFLPKGGARASRTPWNLDLWRRGARSRRRVFRRARTGPVQSAPGGVPFS